MAVKRCLVCQEVHFIIEIYEELLEISTEALQLLQVSLHLHLLRLEPSLFSGFNVLVVNFKLLSSFIDSLYDLVKERVYLVSDLVLVRVEMFLLLLVLINLFLKLLLQSLHFILDTVAFFQ